MLTRLELHLAGEEDRPAHDACVRASPRGHPLQLWSWGEVKRGDGWTPLRLAVLRDGAVSAVASLVERRLGRSAFWFCHRGPVCEPGTREAALLWRGLDELAAERGAVAMRCDPEWPQAEGRLLRSAGLRPLPVRRDWYFGAMEPLRVWRIGLAGGEAGVFARFEPHTRSDVRRSGRKGVTVRAGYRQDLDPFYDLLLATARRRGFPLRSRDFFARLWAAWNEGGDGVLLVAEHEGRLVGGVWAVVCGRGCWAEFLAVDPAAARLLPADALCWASIRHAIARGCGFYDFGGIGHRQDPRDGLWAFKKGFGPGELRFAGEHDRVFRPLAYRAFRLAEEARWAWYGRRAQAAAPRAGG